MEYSIGKLARISHISTRTLRYYDSIGLLRPTRVSSGGYRVYGEREVDRLQQILFYREMGVELAEIAAMLDAAGFDRTAALEEHLASLEKERRRICALIENVKATINAAKGGEKMSDEKKFKGFGEKLVLENEERYGEEIRRKYGDEAVDKSNAYVSGMSAERFAESESIERELGERLRAAAGDPSCPDADKAFELHKKWLSYFSPTYSKAFHAGLAEMYVADERFKAHYDAMLPDGALLLRDIIVRRCAD